MSEAMKYAAVLSGLMLLTNASACGGDKAPSQGGHGHGSGGMGDGHGDGHGGGHGHGGDSISVLRFGKRTELFVEFPPLVAGKDVTFTAHFTLLGERFTPVRKGKVIVSFRSASGVVRRITAGKPSRTGIFEPSGKAPGAGRYSLVFELDSPEARDRFEWKVQVYSSSHAAAHRKREPTTWPAGAQISFLKEQQWVIPFATVAAERRPIRQGFEVAATIEAEPGAHTRLTSSIAGIVTKVSKKLRVGAQVAAKEELASVEPVLLQGTDLPQLQLAAIHARQALKLAELRRDRLRSMLKARAIARLEVDRAEYEVKRHKAAVQAAGSRLWLHQRSRKRQSTSGHGLRIRAPFSATVVRRGVTQGESVVVGQLVVELADLSKLRAVARVGVVDLPRARRAVGASLRLPDGRWVSLRHPPVEGARVDPRTRTVDIAYGLTAGVALPLGAWVRVRLLGPERTVVAIPERAVLDNDGQAVVMVQTGGESFVMRKVGLGVRDRGWIEVTLGVGAGERVVTAGCYQMLLSTKLRGGVQLGHGHAH